MLKTDIQLLANQLNAIAEVFDKKAVSPKSLEVWFDTLRDFPTERVMSVLIGWPKTHTKYPTPAEVWKIVNEICIDIREEKARQEKAIAEQQIQHLGVTPHGEAFIKKIKQILAKPKRSGREHWEWVLAKVNAPEMAKEYALAALKRNVIEREPGMDDEELAA